MTLTLSRRTQRLIEKKVRDGQYECPEDVVSAAIGSLIAHEDFGEFRPGELDALLEEGERSIRKSGTLDGEEAFRRRRAKRVRRKGSK